MNTIQVGDHNNQNKDMNESGVILQVDYKNTQTCNSSKTTERVALSQQQIKLIVLRRFQLFPLKKSNLNFDLQTVLHLLIDFRAEIRALFLKIKSDTPSIEVTMRGKENGK